MEEGSLLSEALNNARGGVDLENALVVDVFLLPTTGTGKNKEDNSSSNSSNSNNINLEQHLLDLADLGVRLNDFIMKQNDTTCTDSSSYYYPWIQGGDGPVFGIHTSLSNDIDNNSSSSSSSNTKTTVMIPHLRAICRYGVSVADEWKMISLVMEFSRQHQHKQQQQKDEEEKKSNKIMVVECIDVDDGQILMIQGADALPEWADRIGPQNCRHRCWIQEGKVHLIAPPTSSTVTTKSPGRNISCYYSLSLSQALDCLLSSSSNSSSNDNNTDKNQSQYHAGVHEHVQQAIDRVVNNNTNAKCCQRTALLVPRSVANLVQRRPDLAAAAYQAWAQQRQQHQPQHHNGRSCNNKDHQNGQNEQSSSSSSLLLAGTCHDWIWTIDNRMSRTVYAMMRTMVSGSQSAANAAAADDDDWTRPDSIPKRYLSIEVKRLQRHVQSLQQPPVLQSSLALGVRLVAGLQQLLLAQQQQQETQTKKSSGNNTTSSMQRQSHVERRVLDYWSRIDQQCRRRAANNSTTSSIDTSNDDDNNRSWLVQAWMDGPNHSQYNIESIMKCPVFTEEVQDNATPITHPDMDLADQIRHELLRQKHNNTITDPSSLQGEIPRPDQVDTDEWMTLPSLTTDQDLLFQQTLGLSSFNNYNKNEPETTNQHIENNGGPAAASLDHMLHGFQDFIKGESGIDGVDHYNNNNSQEKNMPQQQQPIRIHPVAFLNLLHKSLATDSAQELETFLMGTAKTTKGDDDGDPFFSEEDYRLAEPDNTDDDDDDDDDSTSSSSRSGNSSNGDNNDHEMMNLMKAMDSQLLEHDSEALSRPGGTDVRVDDDALLAILSAKQQHDQDQEEIVRDVHVLSNLLESLEAGAGAPGPVQNILSEMSGK